MIKAKCNECNSGITLFNSCMNFGCEGSMEAETVTLKEGEIIVKTEKIDEVIEFVKEHELPFYKFALLNMLKDLKKG